MIILSISGVRHIRVLVRIDDFNASYSTECRDVVFPEEICPIVGELPFSAAVFTHTFAGGTFRALDYPMVTAFCLRLGFFSYVFCYSRHVATPIH